LSRATPSMPRNETVATAPPAKTLPVVLIVDSDGALFGLIEEWLIAGGFKILRKTDDSRPIEEQVGLVILDLPFRREEMLEAVQNVAVQYPHVPVIALSSTFFPGVASHGTVARSLGVSAVIAKPLQQQAFIAAVMTVIRQSA
jgi:DNA-binding response OmpR family regulator